MKTTFAAMACVACVCLIFGWVIAERGWGAGGMSPMRLQMHATDPDRLEPRLGRAESKGWIRFRLR